MPTRKKQPKLNRTNLLEGGDLERAETLLHIFTTAREARVILTAHEMGMFEALRDGGTAAEVAAVCQSRPSMTEDILVVCQSLGLVERQTEDFALTEWAKGILLPESPRYIGGFLNYGEYLWWSWTDLTNETRARRRRDSLEPPEHITSGWHQNFIMAMHGIASNGAAQWLASQVDLTGRKLLLDVGGGPGTYSMVLCQRFPELRAVVWDLPQTLKAATRLIRRFDMSERVSVQPGDWDKDDFGQGYDCLLMSNILHGQDSGAETKLAKASQAMLPGGLLIAHDFLLSNDRSGPTSAALFKVMVGAYTVAELLNVVRSAGFADVSLVACDHRRGDGIVTAIRP